MTASVAASDISELDTEAVPPSVLRVVDDGPEHLLSVGQGVVDFSDLLATTDGSVVVTSFHDARRQGDGYDEWPLRIWTVGEPGSSTVYVPTASTGLAEGPDGSLYVMGEGRYLAREQSGGWAVLSPQRGFAPYIDHAVDGDGTVWAIYGGGLYVFDAEGWRHIEGTQEDDDASSNIERSGDGTLWYLSEDSGLRRLEDGEWHTATSPEALPESSFQSISVAPDGSLWALLATKPGTRCKYELASFEQGEWVLSRMNPRESVKWPRARGNTVLGDPSACSSPRLFAASGDGRAWLTTSQGLEVGWSDEALAVLFPYQDAEHVAIDTEGNAWVIASDMDRESSDLFVVQVTP
jgi:hypothetical protein